MTVNRAIRRLAQRRSQKEFARAVRDLQQRIAIRNSKRRRRNRLAAALGAIVVALIGLTALVLR